jgi:hypothetical protein
MNKTRLHSAVTCRKVRETPYCTITVAEPVKTEIFLHSKGRRGRNKPAIGRLNPNGNCMYHVLYY